MDNKVCDIAKLMNIGFARRELKVKLKVLLRALSLKVNKVKYWECREKKVDVDAAGPKTSKEMA